MSTSTTRGGGPLLAAALVSALCFAADANADLGADAAPPASGGADAERASTEGGTETSSSSETAAAAADESGVTRTAEAPTDDASSDSAVDVLGPGGGIVVVGKRIRDVQRATTEVVSVLSSEDIARTGEGDIAGALGRVTGLSVVGGGFVYVRGLGDRYSQALLNGLPLPSPEPLRRAVPLDLFPTDIIASSLVQKTYSANYPAEFGGGVINLTTLAIPDASFLSVGLGTSGDTVTTGQLGYNYYGSRTDWTGYDNGIRETPPALKAFLGSGQRLSAGAVDAGDIAKQLITPSNALVQRVTRVPVNYSGSITGGTSWLIGENRLGLIATAGYGNKWRTRENTQQTPATFDLSAVDRDYRNVITDNRLVANALVGLTYEFGEHRVRWTNLYVHDTLKQTSLASGKQNNQRTGQDFLEQSTAWYERELLNTQLNAQFKFDRVRFDLRGAYARSKRDAPFEIAMGYSRSNAAASPYGDYFLNRLDNGQTGFASVTFSNLKETLWSTGADVSVDVLDNTIVSAGIDLSSTDRDAFRRQFQIIAPSSFPNGVAMFRPDYLLGAAVIEFYGIGMIETTESDPAFAAALRTKAGYLQVQSELTPGLELSAGVRYERGEQSVRPIQVFNTLTNSGASTALENDYALPTATLTWKFLEDMQVRVNASKTIARPQFRELMFQTYFDPETNRSFRGNPLLVDSEFTNAEVRYEWYFAPEQRFSAAAFWKKIDRPIEAFTGFNDNTPVTSFANAPQATLYGAELEAQKYFYLDDTPLMPYFKERRFVLIGNYAYSKSELKVKSTDIVNVFGTSPQPATNFFVPGAPLSGQSNHLANLQFGLEHPDRLSQQTLLVSYASNRVTSRGAAGLPDIYESPGVSLDFVAREGFSLFGVAMDFKFEARNLLTRGFREFQKRDGNVVYYNKYDIGTTLAVSLSASF
jgi:outer membrane receptor protein involved in Fe transport